MKDIELLKLYSKGDEFIYLKDYINNILGFSDYLEMDIAYNAILIFSYKSPNDIDGEIVEVFYVNQQIENMTYRDFKKEFTYLFNKLYRNYAINKLTT